MPKTFTCGFDFSERVPLLCAAIDGTRVDRFLMDTGAPRTCIHESVAESLRLPGARPGHVRAESLKIAGVEFGPLELKLSRFGDNRIHGVLGFREMQQHCVAVDLDRCQATFGPSPAARTGRGSRIEVFRGRPTVLVACHGNALRFVLDTGSSANWLFADTLAKIPAPEITGAAEQAKSAFGTFPASEEVRVRDLSVGGRDFAVLRFLLAPQDSFGGGRKPEDGILGLAGLAERGKVVMDFPGQELSIRQGADAEPPGGRE